MRVVQSLSCTLCLHGSFFHSGRSNDLSSGSPMFDINLRISHLFTWGYSPVYSPFTPDLTGQNLTSFGTRLDPTGFHQTSAPWRRRSCVEASHCLVPEWRRNKNRLQRPVQTSQTTNIPNNSKRRGAPMTMMEVLLFQLVCRLKGDPVTSLKN